MTEQNNTVQQAQGKFTPEALRSKIDAQKKKQRRESLEKEVKVIVDELEKAQKVVEAKEQQLEELFEANADILD